MDGEVAVVEVPGGALGVETVLVEGVEMLVAAGVAQVEGKTDAVGRERDTRARDLEVGGVEAAPVGDKAEGLVRDRRLLWPLRLNQGKCLCYDFNINGGGRCRLW